MNLKNEPALMLAFVEAALALAVSFGLDLTVEQVGAVRAVVAAATALLLRRQVSPVPRTGATAQPTPPVPRPSAPAAAAAPSAEVQEVLA